MWVILQKGTRNCIALGIYSNFYISLFVYTDQPYKARSIEYAQYFDARILRRRAVDVLTEYSVRCKHSGRRDLHLISDCMIRRRVVSSLHVNYITNAVTKGQCLCIVLLFYFRVNNLASKWDYNELDVIPMAVAQCKGDICY